jgi:hypothetical protein
MAKTHHDALVGMMAVNGNDPWGNSTYQSLRDEIVKIYNGDPISPYQAANVIHSYGSQGGWPAPGASPPDDQDILTEPFWGKYPVAGPGTPTNAERQTRAANNATIQVRYLRAIQEANQIVGGGNLTGLISRMLTPLVTGVTGDDISLPETQWATAPWNGYEMSLYATGVIDGIEQYGLEDVMQGWFLGDEVWNENHSPKEDFRDAAKWIHNVQTAREHNYPFYWTENINLNQNTTDPTSPQATRFNWRNLNGVQTYGVWQDTELKTWFDYFFGGETNLDDATLVFMPYYYPWGTLGQSWRYRKHARPPGNPLSLTLSDNPAWMNWSTILDAFQSTFDLSDADYAARLQFNPIMGLSKQGNLMPRHVDIHKQIRVMQAMREHWQNDYDPPDPRLTGFWLIGWNQIVSSSAPATDGAWKHWTTGYRYAEAIQSEVTAGTEALPAVWVDPITSLPITESKITKVEAYDDPGSTVQGFRIEYQLAPTTVMGAAGIKMDPTTIMGKRPDWYIQIYTMPNGVRDTLVRSITEGYFYPNTLNGSISPHGIYTGDAEDQGAGELIGTAAYWEGYWDHGVDDGENAPGSPVLLDPPGPEHYGAWLRIDGDIIEQTDGLNLFDKTL